MPDSCYSVIVTLYKSSHHLERLLKNISTTVPQATEVILVDNSCEDLSAFESTIVKIIYPLSNLGYGGAINLGVQAATNENVIIANPDIHIKRFKVPTSLHSNSTYILSGITETMVTLPSFRRVGFDIVRIGLCNIGSPFGLLRNISPMIHLNFEDQLAPVDWVPGCLIITNKKTLSMLSGFDEKYFLFYEEVDLCKRASNLQIPRYISDTIIYDNFYGTSSNTDVSATKMEAEMQSMMRYHRIYNGGLTTEILILGLKIWSGLVWAVISWFSGQKAKKKARQYSIYWRSLKPFKGL